jgi:hypothetical protein
MLVFARDTAPGIDLEALRNLPELDAVAPLDMPDTIDTTGAVVAQAPSGGSAGAEAGSSGNTTLIIAVCAAVGGALLIIGAVVGVMFARKKGLQHAGPESPTNTSEVVFSASKLGGSQKKLLGDVEAGSGSGKFSKTELLAECTDDGSQDSKSNTPLPAPRKNSLPPPARARPASDILPPARGESGMNIFI